MKMQRGGGLLEVSGAPVPIVLLVWGCELSICDGDVKTGLNKGCDFKL